ncbi:MAG: inorganic diphosphatase [Candidatus Xenobia bacterium]
MEVVIEIPAWSFSKTSMREGRLVREFLSPLPTLFNYGHVPNTIAGDGMPQDVVVLGPRLLSGSHVDVVPVLRVRFDDDGVVDDKLVATRTGRPASPLERLVLKLFFYVYAAFKCLRYRRLTCRFLGLQELASS